MMESSKVSSESAYHEPILVESFVIERETEVAASSEQPVEAGVRSRAEFSFESLGHNTGADRAMEYTTGSQGVQNLGPEMVEILEVPKNRTPTNLTDPSHNLLSSTTSSSDHKNITIPSNMESGERILVTLKYQNDVFMCETCGISSTSSIKFDEHIARHILSKPYVCLSCMVKFESKAETEHHAFIIHKNKQSKYALQGMKVICQITSKLKQQGIYSFKGITGKDASSPACSMDNSPPTPSGRQEEKQDADRTTDDVSESILGHKDTLNPENLLPAKINIETDHSRLPVSSFVNTVGEQEMGFHGDKESWSAHPVIVSKPLSIPSTSLGNDNDKEILVHSTDSEKNKNTLVTKTDQSRCSLFSFVSTIVEQEMGCHGDKESLSLHPVIVSKPLSFPFTSLGNDSNKELLINSADCKKKKNKNKLVMEIDQSKPSVSSFVSAIVEQEMGCHGDKEILPVHPLITSRLLSIPSTNLGKDYSKEFLVHSTDSEKNKNPWIIAPNTRQKLKRYLKVPRTKAPIASLDAFSKNAVSNTSVVKESPASNIENTTSAINIRKTVSNHSTDSHSISVESQHKTTPETFATPHFWRPSYPGRDVKVGQVVQTRRVALVEETVRHIGGASFSKESHPQRLTLQGLCLSSGPDTTQPHQKHSYFGNSHNKLVSNVPSTGPVVQPWNISSEPVHSFPCPSMSSVMQLPGMRLQNSQLPNYEPCLSQTKDNLNNVTMEDSQLMLTQPIVNMVDQQDHFPVRLPQQEIYHMNQQGYSIHKRQENPTALSTSRRDHPLLFTHNICGQSLVPDKTSDSKAGTNVSEPTTSQWSDNIANKMVMAKSGFPPYKLAPKQLSGNMANKRIMKKPAFQSYEQATNQLSGNITNKGVMEKSGFSSYEPEPNQFSGIMAKNMILEKPGFQHNQPDVHRNSPTISVSKPTDGTTVTHVRESTTSLVQQHETASKGLDVDRRKDVPKNTTKNKTVLSENRKDDVDRNDCKAKSLLHLDTSMIPLPESDNPKKSKRLFTKTGSSLICNVCRKITEDSNVFKTHVWIHFHIMKKVCNKCSFDECPDVVTNCQMVNSIMLGLKFGSASSIPTAKIKTEPDDVTTISSSDNGDEVEKNGNQLSQKNSTSDESFLCEHCGMVINTGCAENRLCPVCIVKDSYENDNVTNDVKSKYVDSNAKNKPDCGRSEQKLLETGSDPKISSCVPAVIVIDDDDPSELDILDNNLETLQNKFISPVTSPLQCTQSETNTKRKNRTYVCKFSGCGYHASSLQELLGHLEISHAKNKKYPCDFCKKTFDSFVDMIGHCSRKVIKMVQCPHCTFQDTEISVVLKHSYEIHPGMASKLKVINQFVCGTKFNLSDGSKKKPVVVEINRKSSSLPPSQDTVVTTKHTGNDDKCKQPRILFVNIPSKAAEKQTKTVSGHSSNKDKEDLVPSSLNRKPSRLQLSQIASKNILPSRNIENLEKSVSRPVSGKVTLLHFSETGELKEVSSFDNLRKIPSAILSNALSSQQLSKINIQKPENVGKPENSLNPSVNSEAPSSHLSASGKEIPSTSNLGKSPQMLSNEMPSPELPLTNRQKVVPTRNVNTRNSLNPSVSRDTSSLYLSEMGKQKKIPAADNLGKSTEMSLSYEVSSPHLSHIDRQKTVPPGSVVAVSRKVPHSQILQSNVREKVIPNANVGDPQEAFNLSANCEVSTQSSKDVARQNNTSVQHEICPRKPQSSCTETEILDVEKMNINMELASKIRCSKCSYVGRTSESTKQHALLHSSPVDRSGMPFQCLVCPDSHETLKTFKEHMNCHVGSHQIKLVYCDICDFISNVYDVVISHLVNTHPSSLHDFSQYISTRTLNVTASLLFCVMCSYFSTFIDDFFKHVASHAKDTGAVSHKHRERESSEQSIAEFGKEKNASESVIDHTHSAERLSDNLVQRTSHDRNLRKQKTQPDSNLQDARTKNRPQMKRSSKNVDVLASSEELVSEKDNRNFIESKYFQKNLQALFKKSEVPENFLCKVCQCSLGSKYKIHKHVLRHLSVWIYKCGYCNYRVLEHSKLCKHKRCCHGNVPMKYEQIDAEELTRIIQRRTKKIQSKTLKETSSINTRSKAHSDNLVPDLTNENGDDSATENVGPTQQLSDTESETEENYLRPKAGKKTLKSSVFMKASSMTGKQSDRTKVVKVGNIFKCSTCGYKSSNSWVVLRHLHIHKKMITRVSPCSSVVDKRSILRKRVKEKVVDKSKPRRILTRAAIRKSPRLRFHSSNVSSTRTSPKENFGKAVQNLVQNNEKTRPVTRSCKDKLEVLCSQKISADQKWAKRKTVENSADSADVRQGSPAKVQKKNDKKTLRDWVNSPVGREWINSKTKTSGKIHKCILCGLKYSDRTNVKRHIRETCLRTSSVKRVFIAYCLNRSNKSNICEQKSNAILWDRAIKRAGSTFACTLCPYQSVGLLSLQHHVSQIHKNISKLIEKERDVMECIKPPPEKECMSTVEKNEELFKCPVCDMTSRYRDNTIRHMKKAHPKDKWRAVDKVQNMLKDKKSAGRNTSTFFKCPVCNMTSRYIENTRRHMKKAHPKDKWRAVDEVQNMIHDKKSAGGNTSAFPMQTVYVCNGCKRSFKSTKMLFEHFRRECINTLYRCPLCRSHFSFKSSVIKAHAFSEHGQKVVPAQCTRQEKYRRHCIPIVGQSHRKHNQRKECIEDESSEEEDDNCSESVSCNKQQDTTVLNYSKCNMTQFYCTKCVFVAATTKAFQFHCNKHHIGQILKCQLCNRFSTRSILHLKHHTMKKHPRATNLKFLITSTNSINSSVIINRDSKSEKNICYSHENLTPIVCKECDYIGLSVNAFGCHCSRMHHGMAFMCLYCDRNVGMTIMQLVDHVKQLHRHSRLKFVFRDPSAQNNPRRQQRKKLIIGKTKQQKFQDWFNCHLCSFSATDIPHLSRHLACHDTFVRFALGKKLSPRSVDIKEKQDFCFLCSYCNKQEETLSAMKNHTKKCHPHQVVDGTRIVANDSGIFEAVVDFHPQLVIDEVGKVDLMTTERTTQANIESCFEMIEAAFTEQSSDLDIIDIVKREPDNICGPIGKTVCNIAENSHESEIIENSLIELSSDIEVSDIIKQEQGDDCISIQDDKSNEDDLQLDEMLLDEEIENAIDGCQSDPRSMIPSPSTLEEIINALSNEEEDNLLRM